MGYDVNSVTLNKEFEILGELPKSLISDFGLEGGKILYKDDTRIQLIQVKGSWCKHCHKMYLTFTNDVCDEIYISWPYFEVPYLD